MSFRSDAQSWGAVTRALHWISAALIVFGLVHGYWMANILPRPERIPHYAWHSLAFIYFGLLLALRIIWRFSEPSPAAPAGSARWEVGLAHLGHLALYLLLIALLVTGYMNWSAFPGRFNPDPAIASRLDLTLLGGIKVPALHDKLDRTVFKFWEDLHKWLAWAMLGLVGLHILAALRHKFIKRNNVMARMWSGRAS